MKASQLLCHPHTQGSCPTPGSTAGPATGHTLVPTETPPQGDRTYLVTPALAGRGWNKHSALTRASARSPPLCQAAVLPQPAWPWGGPMHTGGRAEGSQAVHMGLGNGSTARATGQTLHPPCWPRARAAAGLPGASLLSEPVHRQGGGTAVSLLRTSLNFIKTSLFKSSIGKCKR